MASEVIRLLGKDILRLKRWWIAETWLSYKNFTIYRLEGIREHVSLAFHVL
jgi:hypothetical protein